MVSEKINFLTQIFGIGEQNTDNASVLVKNELSEQFQQLLAQSLTATNELEVAKKTESTETGIVELLISPHSDVAMVDEQNVVNNKTASEEIISQRDSDTVNTVEETIIALQAVNFPLAARVENGTPITAETENIPVAKTQTEIVPPSAPLLNVQKTQQDISATRKEVVSQNNITQKASVVPETKPSEILLPHSISVRSEKNIVQQTSSAVPPKNLIVENSGFEFIAPKESNVVTTHIIAPMNQDGTLPQVNTETEFAGKNNSVVVEQIFVEPEKTTKSELPHNPVIRTRVDSMLVAANESKANETQKIVSTPTVVVTDSKRVLQDGGNAQILSELQTLERSKIKISTFEKGNSAPVIKQDVVSSDVSFKEVVQNIAEDVKALKQPLQKENMPVSPKGNISFFEKGNNAPVIKQNVVSSDVSFKEVIQNIAEDVKALKQPLQKENVPVPKENISALQKESESVKSNTGQSEEKSEIIFEQKTEESKSPVAKSEKRQVVESLKQTVTEKSQQVNTDDSVSSKFMDIKQTHISTAENTSQTIRPSESTVIRNEAPVRYSAALSEQWTKQTIDDIGKAASNVKLTEQSSEIRLKLHPENLGEVTLTVKSENNKMNVTLRVNSSDVKDVLEKNLPMLQETLAQRGLEMRKIEVFNNNDANSQSRHRDEQQQHGQERRKSEIFDETRAKEFERFFGYNTMEKTV